MIYKVSFIYRPQTARNRGNFFFISLGVALKDRQQ